MTVGRRVTIRWMASAMTVAQEVIFDLDPDRASTILRCLADP
jgi:hypothetical protein